MKNIIPSLLVLAAASQVQAAVPVMPPALVGSTVTLGDYVYQQSDKFGENRLSAPTALASATAGANQSGAPFIALQASTSNSASHMAGVYNLGMNFRWSVIGNSQQPVLVHINTKGSITADYGFTPLVPDTYSLSPNTPNVAVKASFVTGVSGQADDDVRTLGAQTDGNFDWGITKVTGTNNFTPQNGGSSTLAHSFDSSFDLWVTPNNNNFVELVATGYLYSSNPDVNQYATEYYKFGAYLSPTITIDAAYAADYALQTSYIPSAVPEPSGIAMLAFGACLIGALARRRKARAG
ncbi:PEP-CTERM sorting domain-containing protein [Rugamonas rivuli]|uniref:PEP-CTERM sorting domain-containing protein n=1 Tax=Rugamonas rivuli TaxID=2743358 RepID=A0A843SHJ9_9BURK|nr:PEP-CTERM sorting domain-containing protein [Rugamonas rivuli]MQA21590.1 PEP-CTERM sorting domain-containing protein [Rugamonas rivuli]